MEIEEFRNIVEFAEKNRGDIDIALNFARLIGMLRQKDAEILALREELQSYKKKLNETVELELVSESVNSVLKSPIMYCGLPQYVAKDLYYSKYGFENLGQVVKHTRKEILSIRNFGGKRLAILEGFLEKHGLKLADE